MRQVILKNCSSELSILEIVKQIMTKDAVNYSAQCWDE